MTVYRVLQEAGSSTAGSNHVNVMRGLLHALSLVKLVKHVAVSRASTTLLLLLTLLTLLALLLCLLTLLTLRACLLCLRLLLLTDWSNKLCDSNSAPSLGLPVWCTGTCGLVVLCRSRRRSRRGRRCRVVTGCA